MVDREKVIKGTECCILTSPSACRGCPYRGTPDDYPFCVHKRLQGDTLKLLKEQEVNSFERLAQATKQAEEFMTKAPYLCYDLAKELIDAAKEVINKG